MNTPPISIPTLQTYPIPSLSPTRSFHLISNLLTPTECTSLIASHTNLIPSNVTPTTIRDREVFADAALASSLWSRIAPLFQDERNGMGKIVDEIYAWYVYVPSPMSVSV
jgi:hypothetical protein